MDKVQHVTDGLRQHFAPVHVGDVRRVPLAKPDQHAFFGVDVFNRKTRPAPVMPGGPENGFQPASGLDFTDPVQAVLQRSEFDVPLLTVIDVLHHATTAGSEDSAARIDTIG